MKVPDASAVQCYTVCLGRTWDKRGAKLMPVLKKYFPTAQVFNAVDAKDLDANNDPRVSIYFKHHHKFNVGCDPVHANKKGVIGCALSHIALWQQCVDSHRPMLVVEDDLAATFRTHGARMRAIYNSIPADAAFASILHSSIAPRSRCGADRWCSIDSRRALTGTLCYYITPVAAQVLLDTAFPITTDIDVYMSYVLSMHTHADTPTTPPLRCVLYQDTFYVEEYDSTIREFWDLSIKENLPDDNGFYIGCSATLLALFVICLVLAVVLLRTKLQSAN